MTPDSSVRIAHVSDPHFGTIYPAVEETLLGSLRALAPQALVLTGDITQRARRGQFLAARSFLERVASPACLVVPGNHDIPLLNLAGRLFDPYHGYRLHLGEDIDGRLRVGPVELIGFNTTSRWRHVQGRLRLAEFRRLPPKDPTLLRIAAFHHPLDCSAPADEKNLLRNARAAVKALSAAGVDAALAGHIHDPHVSLSDTRYPGCGRPFVLATAGTCASWRTRLNAPNSFHLLEASAGPVPALKISRYELCKEEGFRPVSTLSFRRSRGEGWDYRENNPENTTTKGTAHEDQSAPHPGEPGV